MKDLRRFAPATARNREPILAVLGRVLPDRAHVLEIASGTGEHAVFFAEALRVASWQPTDADPDALASIDAWREHQHAARVKPALALDVGVEPWPISAADAVVCINMIHITPWSAGEALLRGAGRLLQPGGVLVLYGPFRRDRAHTAPSNEAFDASLRERDPRWGVRDLEDVEQTALGRGLVLSEVVAMPANNFTVVFHKVRDTPSER